MKYQATITETFSRTVSIEEVKPYYQSPRADYTLCHGDCMELMPLINKKFDMVFADPPYFLSSGGISVQSGKIVSVNKGEWDKSMSQEDVNAFNMKWLSLCREKMKDNGTIWISGTYHNIFSVANALTALGLLSRIIMASTKPGAWILDPFAGSGTTGIAANLLGRQFLGIEREPDFAAMSRARREEIENVKTLATYKHKIADIVKAEDTQTDIFACCDTEPFEELPF